MSTLCEKFKMASVRLLAPAMLLGATSAGAKTHDEGYSHKSMTQSIESYGAESCSQQVNRYFQDYDGDNFVGKTYHYNIHCQKLGQGYYTERVSGQSTSYGKNDRPKKTETDALYLVNPDGSKTDISFVDKLLKDCHAFVDGELAPKYHTTRNGKTKIEKVSVKEAHRQNNKIMIMVMKALNSNLTLEQGLVLMPYIKGRIFVDGSKGGHADVLRFSAEAANSFGSSSASR